MNDRYKVSKALQRWVPYISLLRCGILLLALSAPSSFAHAQGCTQCRDNASTTPPKTQAAYRHAIVLLIVTAGTLFTGTVVLLKRSR